MAKKKRSSKKKQSRSKQQQSKKPAPSNQPSKKQTQAPSTEEESKPATQKKAPKKAKSRKKAEKEAPLEHQSAARVTLRMSMFLLVSAGIFYVTLYHVVGGNATWKVYVLVALPYAYLPIRSQAFETSGFFNLLKPTLSRLLWSVAAFFLANGLCWLLLRYAIQGHPAGDTPVRVAKAALFVVSPMFAFAMNVKISSWAAFASQNTPFQLVLVLVSFFYYYGCVSLAQLEKNHLPAKQEPLHMLPV